MIIKTIKNTNIFNLNFLSKKENNQSELIDSFNEFADKSNISLAKSSLQISDLLKLMSNMISIINNVHKQSEIMNTSSEKIQKTCEFSKGETEVLKNESSFDQKILLQLSNESTENNILLENSKKTIIELSEKSIDVTRAVNIIKDIAEQTKLLSFNASLEASRAGEQGKGFSVVAHEVKKLSDSSMKSVYEIDQIAKYFANQTSKASEQIIEVQNKINLSVEKLNSISKKFLNNIENIENLNQNMNDIFSLSRDNFNITSTLKSNSNDMKLQAIQVHEKMSTISSDAISITELGEEIYEKLLISQVNSYHLDKMKLAQHAAKLVENLFSESIKNNTITKEKMFSKKYMSIKNTNPEKYNSDFDDFTDNHLPKIQEEILNDTIIYAITVNTDGYCPTHNLKFSCRLTGDYNTDLAKNRTKRIFNDRIGIRCGKNTRKVLLQTYIRDTGEIMHDISVPIFLCQEHWGAFRIGYYAKKI